MPEVYTLPTNHTDNVSEIITAATINNLSSAANEISGRRWQYMPKHLSGHYYSSRSFFGGTATLATLTANQIYANYVPIPEAGVTYDRIDINVGSLSVGAIARVMVFADDGTDGRPGTLLLDAGTVSVATTGIKAITISFVPPYGGIWASVVSDGAPQLWCVNSPYVSPMGEDVNTNRGLGWKYSLGSTTAPDPFYAAATLDITSMFIIRLRRA